MQSKDGALYLVGTPIGNLGDMTLRAIETLKFVDIIACEDVRVTQKLLNFFEIKKNEKHILCHEHNEDFVAKLIVQEVELGKSVAYVSDAGMPVISDPGFSLLKCAREHQIKIVIIPGVSSITTALVGSGMESVNFFVHGFLSSSVKHRQEELEKILVRDETVILFETPHKLMKTLEVIGKLDKGRLICVAREMTKIFEEFKRGTAEELINYYLENTLKGELILVLEKPEKKKVELGDLVEIIAASLVKNNKSETARLIAKEYGINRSKVYDFILKEF